MKARAYCLTEAAVHILNEPVPANKVALTRGYADDWHQRRINELGEFKPPVRPARPAHPALMAPRDMPRRSQGSQQGRIAFLHAIAHIELNAIDLAWDIIARFADQGMSRAFYDDWVTVAADEAKHFALLVARLRDLGADYGDLPAHDGLWEAAERTSDDLMARLAIVPMNLEARGLDTTPAAIKRFRSHGDEASAEILQLIAQEEIGHVAAGVRWFEHLAAERNLDSVEVFRELIAVRFTGRLKGPFDLRARAAAGMRRAYFEPAD